MNRFGKAGKLLSYTVGAVTGLKSGENHRPHPLSGINIEKIGKNRDLEQQLRPLLDLLSGISSGRYVYQPADTSGTRTTDVPTDPLAELVRRGVGVFLQYYSRPEQAEKVDAVLDLFESGVEPELLAEAISKVWMPELEMDDSDIVKRWRLTKLKPSRNPIRPDQVMLQLNALYTLPDEGAGTAVSRLPEKLRKQAERIKTRPGKKVADYDHPVPLYEEDGKHELLNCLQELDQDIAFEKEQQVLPQDHRVPVLLSISVTHEALDQPAGDWIEWLLEKMHFHHLQVIVLTETVIRRIKHLLSGERGDSAGREGSDPFPVFSVFGTYGRHFTALKYAQLLLEKPLGVRAGFKLDTDEGIRSRDLHAARGKTWFETLCHSYWNGTALDWQERPVLLAVNEGEYINSSDIDKYGYPDALRAPDVSIPNSWSGPSMFFQKGFAHGRTTAIYNTFGTIEEGISHTVVKGGGYGITNEGLRKAAPFTFSWVGRAEDQQFYFSGIPGGVRGIFHPDLRIAHYKSMVSGAEERTAATRFIGDMYRLIIFQRLANLLEVKSDIDPMPGVFAGELARAQAAFATMMKVLEFASRGDEEAVRYILEEGMKELLDLEDRIDRGRVDSEFRREKKMWENFIHAAQAADGEKIRKWYEA